MERRAIWIAVAVAVLGAAGYLAYDLTLGKQMRQGAALKAAIAERFEAIGIVYTSLKHDWRTNTIVAANLSPTKLPGNVSAATIERAVYRGAPPAAYDAVLDNGAGGGEARVRLVDELTLTNLLIAFSDGTAITQPKIKLVNVSMRPIRQSDIPQTENMSAAGKARLAMMLRVLDGFRSLHVGLFEASDGRVWIPNGRVEYKQALFRLEDYHGGDFSELRLEGLTLTAALVARLKLDEYFIEAVEAAHLFDSLYETTFWGAYGAKDWPGALSGMSMPAMAEWYPRQGDSAIIGFEMLIPAVGRIAIAESLVTDRQFINGYELGGKSKLTGFEMQSGMLATVLTAALNLVSKDAALQLANSVGEAMETLTATPVLQQDRARPGDNSDGKKAKPGGPPAPDSGDGVKAWSNPVRPPTKAKPEWDNKTLGRYMGRLGFTNIHIDGASVTTFDVNTNVWEWPKFEVRMRDFWDLNVAFRLSGMGAVADMGLQPPSPPSEAQKAEHAFWKRLAEEGRIDKVQFAYQDKGFIKRLMKLLAEEQGTTVDSLAAATVAGLFRDSGAFVPVWAEGLDTALEEFLKQPQGFTIAVMPAKPVPFSMFEDFAARGESAGGVPQELGLSLTLNGRTFAEFKKSGPIGRDNTADPD